MSWNELVARIGMDGGYLLYAGKIGVIAAEVQYAELNAQMHTVNVTSITSPYTQVIPGPVDVTFTAQLTDKYLWDQSHKTGGGDPPNLNALVALARRHPGEYAELCEGEAILKALGG